VKDLVTFLKEALEKVDSILSLSVIGSGVNKTRLCRNDELDLYVLIDTVTARKLRQIKEILLCAKCVVGKEPFIETRRGPFRRRDTFQFHLIVDDLNSIQGTSSVTLADWARNSLLLKGQPIDFFVRDADLWASFREEIEKTLRMLASRRIVFKEWYVGECTARLIQKEMEVRSVSGFCELLKYAYTAMKNDYAALREERSAADLVDACAVRNIEFYRRGNLWEIDFGTFYSRVLGWNHEVYRAISFGG